MMIIVTVDLQSLCHAALNRLRIFYMRHQFYILKDSFLYQVTWIRFFEYRLITNTFSLLSTSKVV